MAALVSTLALAAASATAAAASSSDRRASAAKSDVASAASTAAASASGGDPPPPPSYSRYPRYPPYCSTPAAMAGRPVPALQSPERHASAGGVGGTALRQVVALIRHGARTPWSPGMRCWDGYWTDPETGAWDCELTTLMAPPSPPFAAEAEAEAEAEAREDGDGAMFLFEKRYDALRHPPALANGMNGTCQIGQLLVRGYEQETANGRRLRGAYVYDGSDARKETPAARDGRMRLFDLTRDSARRPYEPPNLRYRADDEQRTLMSGQVLLRGMFGDLLRAHRNEKGGRDPVIATHTADYDYDVLAPRAKVCPRLDDLREEAEGSAEFRAFNASKEAQTLRRMMVETMGADFGDNAIDCLMTTMCTDRPLPDVLNDYRGEEPEGAHTHNAKAEVGDQASAAASSSSSLPSDYDHLYGPNRFARLLDFAVRRSTHKLTYNDAAYSKLGMGPLWREILDQMTTVLRPQPHEEGDDDGHGGSGSAEAGDGPTRLALFSGHDSTLMPLLATLGRNVFDGSEWSPYASMVIIEVHEITKRTESGGSGSSASFRSDHAFRLLYNGDVLTPRVPGCPPDLDICDVSVLLDRVGPFATVDRDCASSKGEEKKGGATEEVEEAAREAEALLSTPGGMLLFVLSSAACVAMGAAGMYVYLTRKLQVKSGAGGSFYRRETGETEATTDPESSNDEWVYGNGRDDKDDDRISWQLS